MDIRNLRDQTRKSIERVWIPRSQPHKAKIGLSTPPSEKRAWRGPRGFAGTVRSGLRKSYARDFRRGFLRAAVVNALYQTLMLR